MTTITIDTPLEEAARRRDAELKSAQDAYTENCRATNEAFAAVVRKEAESSSMSDVARQLGMNRQNLHRIVGQRAAAA